MARGNRSAAPTNRRRNINRRRYTRRSRPTSNAIVRNGSRGGLLVKGLRDLAYYSRNVDGTTPRTSSWLDKLWSFGAIALKLFLLVVGEEELLIPQPDGSVKKVRASEARCTGASQSIWIGAEDLIQSNAIVEFESRTVGKSTVMVPHLDYRQALVRSLFVHVTCGSQFETRAGRYCAVLLNATEEELSEYMPDKIGAPWKEPDSWSFTQTSQMPGALIAPYGVPLCLRWRATPNTYSRRALAIGQRSIDSVDFTKNLGGGRPVCRLIVAYQDFATNDGSVSGAYSPSELMIQVQLRSNVHLSEPGRTYIRSAPIPSQNPGVAGVATETTAGQHIYQLPLSALFTHNNKMYVTTADLELAKSCKSLDLEQMHLE